MFYIRKNEIHKNRHTMDMLIDRGQSSKILREISEDDKTAFIQKNGKPLAVVMSYDRYQRLYEKGVDITEF